MAAVDVGVLFVKNIQVVCLSVQVAVVEIRSERKGKIGCCANTHPNGSVQLLWHFSSDH